MTFDDADSKMTRDEMRYMLETEGVLENEELEMLQGVFFIRYKSGTRSNGSSDRRIHG